MAIITKIKKPGWDKFNEKVLGTRTAGGYDPTYDTTLENDNASGNLVLKITLRMFLNKVEPDKITEPVFRALAASRGITVPPGTTPGGYLSTWNKNAKMIGDWPDTAWNAFRNNVATQAKVWDGKFWLIPPDNFDHFDRAVGSWATKENEVIIRPNIKCEFKLEFAASASNAHAKIDAINLLDDDFRADSATYTSQSTIPTFHSFYRDQNNTLIPTVQSVIAHEVGHAIGQPHIGQQRNLPLCNLAIAQANLPGGSAAGVFVGGIGATVCYGYGASAGDINNIMGVGSVFSIENAKPWLDRILDHLNLSMEDLALARVGLHSWKVSMDPVKPQKTYSSVIPYAGESDISAPRIAITQRDTVVKDFELDGNLLFDVGKADIKQGAEAYMHLTGSFVVQFPNNIIKFCGHTDSTGSRDMNQKLSLKRAEAVMKWFRAKNYVTANRSLAEGYGEDQPKVPNTSEANRAQNRRVVVKVYAKR